MNILFNTGNPNTNNTATANPIKRAAVSFGILQPQYNINHTDSFGLSPNSASYINKQLRTVYGINSQIPDPDLAKTVLESVKDFCNINRDNSLFSGLNINTEKSDLPNEHSKITYDVKSSNFKITFNENTNWKEFEKTAKKMYEEGAMPSDNPKCYIYSQLGQFLNFKYNPYAYDVNAHKLFDLASQKKTFKITNNSLINSFTGNYIAAKMCGVNLPQRLSEIYEENLGNIDLKFPNNKPEHTLQGNNLNFNTILDARKYLISKYGIESNFINLKQANQFASAVEDLVQAIGNPNIFRNMQVIIDHEKIDSVYTKASLNWNYETGNAFLYLNPAFNYKNAEKTVKRDYDTGHNSTNRLKDIYLHELVHWLDFKGNPEIYGKTENEFKNGEKHFNDFEINAAAKVSGYATQSPAEFIAEYVCGRLSGKKYPEVTNKEFERTWLGPKLNFP